MTTKPRIRNHKNISLHKDTVKLIDDIRATYDPEISRNALIKSWAKQAKGELAGCREIICLGQTGDPDHED